MAEIQLDAEIRNEFGKGASRRLRRAGKVPAVLYGHGTDPVHVSLPSHATLLALREANALLNLNIDGRNQLTSSEVQLFVAYYTTLQRLAELERATATYPLSN